MKNETKTIEVQYRRGLRRPRSERDRLIANIESEFTIPKLANFGCADPSASDCGATVGEPREDARTRIR